MSDPTTTTGDIPAPPVRLPTPTLDAFHQAILPGRQRFFQSPDVNEIGERDEALELYKSGVNPLNGNAPIAPELMAMVSKVDYYNAKNYPTLFSAWCNTYNGGKPPTAGNYAASQVRPLTQADLAKAEEPVERTAFLLPPPPPPAAISIADAKKALAAEMPPAPPVRPPAPKPPPVIVPPKKPSVLSRIGAMLKALYLQHIA
jgi:hypothetical protein